MMNITEVTIHIFVLVIKYATASYEVDKLVLSIYYIYKMFFCQYDSQIKISM